MCGASSVSLFPVQCLGTITYGGLADVSIVILTAEGAQLPACHVLCGMNVTGDQASQWPGDCVAGDLLSGF